MRNSAAAALCAVALAGAQRDDPSIDAIVAKASAYVARYESELGGLVAQEDYQQDLPQLRRRLKSDFLLVKFSADGPWIPFRDVIEVDGKPLGDRDKRLETLFLSADPNARDNAERITRESARYNIGRYYRTTNVPLIGLFYLQPDHVARSRFHDARTDTFDGSEVWKIQYSEQAVATVVHDGRGGNLPAAGTIWIRQTDGAVLQTIVRLETPSLRSIITVRFCAADGIPMLVPCRMEEDLIVPREHLKSVATYSNVRQFKVATSESIKR